MSRGIGRPFPKGVSGNPNGRPKSNLNKLLSVYLQGKDPRTRRSREQLLVESVVRDAIRGDRDARILVWNHLEGKPRGQLDVTSGGIPISLADLLGGEGTRDGAHDGKGVAR